MMLTRAMYFVWVVSTLGGLAIFLGTVWRLLRSRPLRSGFRLPALALELVQDEEQVKAIEEKYPPERIRRDLRLDLFVFIPLYLALFLALGYWLLRSDALPYAHLLGIAASLCVAGAALFDVLENLRTFSVLRQLNQSGVDRIRRAALAKWSLFFVMMALLAIPFAWQGGWLLIVAAIYLIAAGTGIIGLVWHRPLIEWAFALVGLALAPTGEAIYAIAERIPT
jgi:hypothetical protein